MTKKGVLFVCTGNICRSPTAEGVFRHIAAQNQVAERFFIDSAGTHGYHVGDPPDNRSIAAASERGVNLSDLRARRFESTDFDKFDYIIAMDGGHMDILGSMMISGTESGLHLFLDFTADKAGQDVPDPYYGGAQDFEHVLDLVEEASRGLLDHILAEAA